MGMIITVGNIKGGVGKTILSLQIALGLAERGQRVVMVDTDPLQTTALNSLTLRGDRKPAVMAVAYVEPTVLRTQVRHQTTIFDTVVIDVGGKDNPMLTAALMITDRLIVPYTPDPYDVWSLDDMSKVLRKIDDLRDPPEVMALLNKVEPGKPKDRDAAIQEARNFAPRIRLLETRIGRSDAIKNASAHGLTVTEYPHASSQARESIAALIDELFPATAQAGALKSAAA